MSKWITGNNVVIGGLKKLGSSLVERIKDWRGMGKAAEEANTKSGGTTPSTTGGFDPKNGSWKEQTANQIKGDAQKYARAAVAIAAAIAKN